MHRTPHIVYTVATAAYDSQLQTIRLPVAWNGSSPSELAVFVNAMARHLQNEAGADYRCSPSNSQMPCRIDGLRCLALSRRG